MRVLFIGGTGNISLACTREAVRKGIEVFHLNRGKRGADVPAEVETITADIRNVEEARTKLTDLEFDVVVDWIAFTPEHINNDLELFRERARQFVFISSASVYHKPVRHPVITESTPAHNPFWTYSQQKIACEQLLFSEYAKNDFPITIVRPSHTYSDGWFPTTFGKDFTVPQRILNGKPIVVHGDGQSLWTITHADDFARAFVGLLGEPAAIGETFHITSDEAITWDQIHLAVGHALGREPELVHVPSETISRFDPEFGAGLLGDKRYSVIFDNAKIKRYVPGYHAEISFAEVMRRSAAFYAKHPEAKQVNEESNAFIETLIEAIGAVKP